MNLSNAEFVRSAAKRQDFPADDRKRIVFVGRSNVGKSSSINAILNRRNMARVSAMPGKTVFVNLFLIDQRLWLVDLPGYGYSKTSKEERGRYSRLINDYLDYDLERIARLYLIVDARHKPTADDCTMMEWLRTYGVPVTVIANKLDKLKKSEIEPNLKQIVQTLKLGEDVKLIAFSAEKKTNRDLVVADILEAYQSKGSVEE